MNSHKKIEITNVDASLEDETLAIDHNIQVFLVGARDTFLFTIISQQCVSYVTNLSKLSERSTALFLFVEEFQMLFSCYVFTCMREL